MSRVWRAIRRSSKKATKYRYNISCKELLLECAHKWRPESIVVACIHRKRRYVIGPRRLDWSFDNPTRAMIMWPDSQDPLNLITTLFRSEENDQFDDKEWTLVVEEVTAKGKHRPLAAISINIRLFITDLPATRIETRFKLRPLRKEVMFCTLQLDIASKLLRETDIIEPDRKSVASVASYPEDKISVPARQELPVESKERQVSVKYEESAYDAPIFRPNFDRKPDDSVRRPVAAPISPPYDEIPDSLPITYHKNPLLNEQQKRDFAEITKEIQEFSKSSLLDETPASEVDKSTESVDKEHVEQVKSLADDLKDLRFSRPPNRSEDDESNARVESLRQQARKMLQNPSAVVADSNIDEERRKQLQEELRRLKDESSSPPVSNNLAGAKPLKRTTSARSNATMGSNTDLRTLDVVTTQTNFRPFKKIEPSPQLQRKTYDNPILPAYGRASNQPSNGSSDRINHNLSPSTSTPVISAFDRMKRFGSMRGQELAESLAQFISPGLEFLEQKQPPPPAPAPKVDPKFSTPKRKLYSRLEKDLRNSVDPSLELQKIGERIEAIERQDADIVDRLQHMLSGSSEEQELIVRHMELTSEKDELVRRQDYFNVLADLNETKEKLTFVREKIAGMGNNVLKTEAEVQANNDLMQQLKQLIDRQDQLTQDLINKEAEEEHEKERSRQTLERTRNFNRAPQESLSASKRLFNVFR